MNHNKVLTNTQTSSLKLKPINGILFFHTETMKKMLSHYILRFKKKYKYIK